MMNIRRCLPLLLPVLLAGLLGPHAALAAVYKWTDAAGVTHYAHTPPPEQHFSVVETSPQSRSSQTQPATSNPATAADAAPSDPRAPGAVAVTAPQADAEKCQQVAADMEKLTNTARIRLQSGETSKILTDEEKQALIEERRVWHEKYCGE